MPKEKVRCKKNYIVKHDKLMVLVFQEGREYEIIDIDFVHYHVRSETGCIHFGFDRWLITVPEMQEHFYTLSELRKLKLQKLERI